MTTKTIAGVPVGGLKTVGQINGTNDLLFQTGQNGLAVAVELLSTHTPGALSWMTAANLSASSVNSMCCAHWKSIRT